MATGHLAFVLILAAAAVTDCYPQYGPVFPHPQYLAAFANPQYFTGFPNSQYIPASFSHPQYSEPGLGNSAGGPGAPTADVEAFRVRVVELPAIDSVAHFDFDAARKVYIPPVDDRIGDDSTAEEDRTVKEETVVEVTTKVEKKTEKKKVEKVEEKKKAEKTEEKKKDEKKAVKKRSLM